MINIQLFVDTVHRTTWQVFVAQCSAVKPHSPHRATATRHRRGILVDCSCGSSLRNFIDRPQFAF